MSSIQVAFAIIAPIAILSLTTTAFVLARAYVKYKRSAALATLKTNIRKERMMRLEADMAKIHSVARSNNKYSELFTHIEGVYEAIDKLMSRLTVLNNALVEDMFRYRDRHGRTRLMTSHKFHERVAEVEKKVDELNALERDFTIIGNQITNQDELLRSEFTFYQTNLRQALEIYQAKRLLMDRIRDKIATLTEHIGNYETEFNASITKGQMGETAKCLRQYTTAVTAFCEIVAEEPMIQTYIFDIIPQRIEALRVCYRQSQDLNNGSLRLIDFDNALRRIIETLRATRDDYLQLHMVQNKRDIKLIMKAIKMLERQITHENMARTAFIGSRQSVYAEVETALRHYVAIKNQLRTQVAIGRMLSPELRHSYNEVKAEAKNLDESLDSLRGFADGDNVAFSVKVARAQVVIEQTRHFIAHLNSLAQSLASLNGEMTHMRNRFARIEAAVSEIVANTKRQNILFSPEEQSQYGQIMARMRDLSNAMRKDQMTPETINQMNVLVRHVASFYRTIGINLQFAEITMNLVRECSPYRALDDRANQTFLQVERLYLDGKYADALNMSVQYLERRVK